MTSRTAAGPPRHLIALLGTLLTAALLLGPSPAQAKDAVAFPTKPRAGACHQVEYDAATGAIHGKATSCREHHNLVTIAVPTAPRSLTGLSRTEIAALASDTCEPILLKRLGRTAVERETSAYRLFLGYPSPAQIEEGARWLRCDLALAAGTDLLPLPVHLSHPILGKRLSDDTEKCVTAAGLVTTCSRRHAYRPVGAVTFRPMSYPTQASFEHASTRCPAHTRWWTAAAEGRWAAGDRVLVCYAKTTK